MDSPENIDFEMPYALVPAKGFKALTLRAKVPSLISPYHTSIMWFPTNNGVLKAVCRAAIQAETPEHEAPAPYGIHKVQGCGIYAHYTLRGLVISESPKLLHDAGGTCYGARVVAVMEGWGNIQAHESDADGWRAEYAKIAALCRPVEQEDRMGLRLVTNALQTISEALAVPLIERDEAEAFGRTIGVSLAPKDRME